MMVFVDEGAFMPAWMVKLVTKRRLKALRSKKKVRCSKGRR